MASIIEVANSAYEERDKAQERLALMMKKAERERVGDLHAQAQQKPKAKEEASEEGKSDSSDSEKSETTKH